MELTKQNIKEVFVETLEPFTKAVQGDFQKVNQRLDKVEFELVVVKQDLAEVKSDVKWMKENFSELFTKLDEFISLFRDQIQENKLLADRLSRLEEKVAKLESTLGKK